MKIVMIQDPMYITVLILAIPVLIFILFLPVIAELKNQKEGSHVIIDDTNLLQDQTMDKTSIVDIDIAHEFDKETTNALREVVKLIPNLEA